jgi:CHAT domain-containing protein
MAVYAVIMGMRAATKAPASEFTAKSLEREVPIAGLYVGDSRQYYNKLSQIAMEIDNVTKQIPDEAMNRKEKDFISTKVDEMLTKARQEPKPNLDDNPYRKRSK